MRKAGRCASNWQSLLEFRYRYDEAEEVAFKEQRRRMPRTYCRLGPPLASGTETKNDCAVSESPE